MNSSWTVLCGRLICLASLAVQRLNSDELVVSSAPLLTVLLITFFLADIAEGGVTAQCIDRQLTGRGTAAQCHKSFLKLSHV